MSKYIICEECYIPRGLYLICISVTFNNKVTPRLHNRNYGRSCDVCVFGGGTGEEQGKKRGTEQGAGNSYHNGASPGCKPRVRVQARFSICVYTVPSFFVSICMLSSIISWLIAETFYNFVPKNPGERVSYFSVPCWPYTLVPRGCYEDTLLVRDLLASVCLEKSRKHPDPFKWSVWCTTDVV